MHCVMLMLAPAERREEGSFLSVFLVEILKQKLVHASLPTEGSKQNRRKTSIYLL